MGCFHGKNLIQQATNRQLEDTKEELINMERAAAEDSSKMQTISKIISKHMKIIADLNTLLKTKYTKIRISQGGGTHTANIGVERTTIKVVD